MVVVVDVTLVGPNGEFFISLNTVDVKGELLVLGVPKVTPVFVVPNGVLEELAVVAVPVLIPNVEKAAVLVASNCETAVAKGLVVVEDVTPNGEALEVDIGGVLP